VAAGVPASVVAANTHDNAACIVLLDQGFKKPGRRTTSSTTLCRT
jgi:hypothetical protein